jgi:hypothetical protein
MTSDEGKRGKNETNAPLKVHHLGHFLARGVPVGSTAA